VQEQKDNPKITCPLENTSEKYYNAGETGGIQGPDMPSARGKVGTFDRKP
jgi:hypothetical protein